MVDVIQGCEVVSTNRISVEVIFTRVDTHFYTSQVALQR